MGTRFSFEQTTQAMLDKRDKASSATAEKNSTKRAIRKFPGKNRFVCLQQKTRSGKHYVFRNIKLIATSILWMDYGMQNAGKAHESCCAQSDENT